MPVEHVTSNGAERDENGLEKRPTWQSIFRGWRKKCPSCGEGKIFSGYLTVNDQCSTCGEELHHQRADDAPPYFTIFVVGHAIIPSALWLEMTYSPAVWLQMLIWVPLTVLLSLWLLPQIKGALIGLQWALRMHGFDDQHVDHDADGTIELPR